MNWLIVEDALRNRTGHWFEYLSTFHQDLTRLGDQVTILCDRHAETEVREPLRAEPVLPASIWHRMSDRAGRLRRWARIPLHAWNTRRAMTGWLRSHSEPDWIFVPTVLVHHLLGWSALIRAMPKESRTRVLLFFPNLPLRLDPETGEPSWQGAGTTRLLGRLLKKMRPEIDGGRVVLGVETLAMRNAFSRVTGLPVSYLPHPVHCLTGKENGTSDSEQPGSLLFGCYGFARHEKGSDLLQAAIKLFLQRSPETRVRFSVQWTGSFRDDRGRQVTRDAGLEADPRVEFITRVFSPGEYEERLGRTDTLLLPYRASSYRLRVSRVLLEGLVNGIPVVAPEGTTLADQAREFGALTPHQEGSAESLAAAIERQTHDLEALKDRALERMPEARRHFSVAHFRSLLPR